MTALRKGVNPDSTSYVSKPPTTSTTRRAGPIDVKTYGGTSGGSINLRRRR